MVVSWQISGHVWLSDVTLPYVEQTSKWIHSSSWKKNVSHWKENMGFNSNSQLPLHEYKKNWMHQAEKRMYHESHAISKCLYRPLIDKASFAIFIQIQSSGSQLRCQVVRFLENEISQSSLSTDLFQCATCFKVQQTTGVISSTCWCFILSGGQQQIFTLMQPSDQKWKKTWNKKTGSQIEGTKGPKV